MNELDKGKNASPCIYSSYDREKALAYWNRLEPERVSFFLVGEMESTMRQIRAYVEDGLSQRQAIDALQSHREFSLAHKVQSITESFKNVYALVNIMYRYNHNWEEKKRLAENGKSVAVDDVGFLENVPTVYASRVPIWYKKEPADFLSIFIPVIEPEILKFHTLVKGLQAIHDLDKIILASSPDVELTLGGIANALLKESSILSEELFLLSSYSRSHSV